MARITKARVESILREKLSLKAPEFFLRNFGGRVVGSVVSQSFKRRRDHERQNMIWAALEEALGSESGKMVGMILAYTPDEWNVEPASNGKRVGAA